MTASRNPPRRGNSFANGPGQRRFQLGWYLAERYGEYAWWRLT